jgi:hypothetical protein
MDGLPSYELRAMMAVEHHRVPAFVLGGAGTAAKWQVPGK